MNTRSGRRIVFVNQATGYLTIDIVNAFATCDQFETVALIAGSVRVQDVQIAERVRHSKIALYDRGTPRKKLLSWLKGTLQICLLLMGKYRRYEIFYITIPPFAYLLSLLFQRRFSILVFDVYPDVLQIYNVRPSNIIYKLWAKMNKVLFRRAHRVYTIGNGMAKLLYQYVEPQKVTVIPNWTGLTNVQIIEKTDNFFIEQEGLQSKFIVQYSGNIGYTHNVELVLDLAEKLLCDDDVFFLIIGRGEKFNTIRTLVNQRGLSNCRLLPFQPDEILNFTLGAAHLGVVLLDDKAAHVSVPSKIYNLQAVGVPILAIADTSSELASHVAHYDNGVCFGPRDLQQIIEFITRLKSDLGLYNRLSKNALQAASDFTSENAKLYLHSYLSDSPATSVCTEFSHSEDGQKIKL